MRCAVWSPQAKPAARSLATRPPPSQNSTLALNSLDGRQTNKSNHFLAPCTASPPAVASTALGKGGSRPSCCCVGGDLLWKQEKWSCSQVPPFPGGRNALHTVLYSVHTWDGVKGQPGSAPPSTKGPYISLQPDWLPDKKGEESIHEQHFSRRMLELSSSEQKVESWTVLCVLSWHGMA